MTIDGSNDYKIQLSDANYSFTDANGGDPGDESELKGKEGVYVEDQVEADVAAKKSRRMTIVQR